MAGDDGSPIRLFVEIESLVALRTSMEAIRSDLATTSSADLRTDSVATGGAEVSDALGSFIGNWHDGRQRIDTNLSACVDLLGQAIDAYVAAEQTIGGAMSGNH